MTFSVIIPTFNSAKTLNLCLDSLVEQSFTNFEVLIIDNRSADTTLVIANTYLAKLNLRIYSNKDRGIYDAMNKGINLAMGNYLYFLGSDDSLHNQYVLEKVADEIARNKMKILYGNALVKSITGEVSYLHGGKFDLRRLMNDNISHQAIFYHNEIFTKVGNFNLKYTLFADHDLNLRCMANYNLHFMDIVIANFSKGGATSVQKDEAFLRDKYANFIKYNLKRLHTSAYIDVRLFIQKAALSRSLNLNIGTRLYCLLAYTKLKLQSLLV